MDNDQETALSRTVIGLAIEVHRHLGPELMESAYQECLCFELGHAEIPHIRHLKLPVRYKGNELGCSYQMDIVVDSRVVIEVTAVAQILPIHAAQLLTYLRLSGLSLGLLMNFNSPMLKDGIRRRRL
jgi:GxxExxY protein